jgi:hypothetical protein
VPDTGLSMHCTGDRSLTRKPVVHSVFIAETVWVAAHDEQP